MKLLLGKDFPASPPKGYFLTKIFHPNVGANGEICVNVLKRDWTAELGIRHVLLVSSGVAGHCFFKISSEIVGASDVKSRYPAFQENSGRLGNAGWDPVCQVQLYRLFSARGGHLAVAQVVGEHTEAFRSALKTGFSAVTVCAALAL